MLSYLVSSPCDECMSASYLKTSINKALSKIGRRMWLNKAFMLKKPLNKERLKVILYYKNLLDNLEFDPFYFGPKYPYEKIDSRIKSLINGLH